MVLPDDQASPLAHACYLIKSAKAFILFFSKIFFKWVIFKDFIEFVTVLRLFLSSGFLANRHVWS